MHVEINGNYTRTQNSTTGKTAETDSIYHRKRAVFEKMAPYTLLKNK